MIMKSKILIGLIIVLTSTIGQAQNNSKYQQPDMTVKTHSFLSPELLVDSTFIEKLNTLLFKQDDRYMQFLLANHHSKTWHIHIQFTRRDSLNYCLVVSVEDIPARRSMGFYEHDGIIYWFGKDAPSNIILGTKASKHFSYKDHIPAPYDPPFMFFVYNSETGILESEDDHCLLQGDCSCSSPSVSKTPSGISL